MFAITSASISETGDRKNNEDFIGLEQEPNKAFFAVADGLGGHGQGEVASEIAVQKALEAYGRKADSLKEYGKDATVLDACFIDGQEAILREQQLRNARGDLKTTLVLLEIDGATASWGHIGDARLYYFGNNKLKLRTLDHSVPQMLVATGEIREKDIRKHEDRNRLLRVMGTEWSSPRYQLAKPITLGGNDSFLLCTDGFWEYVDEKAMQRTLKLSKTADAWLDLMCAEGQRASQGSNRDNYSAIAVFVRQ